MDRGVDADDLFEDLERQFRRAEGAHRRRKLLTMLGGLAGFFLIFVGFTTHFFVSVAGYGLMFVCVWSLAEGIKGRAALRFREATQRASEQQWFGRPRR
jgi:hypothetical protein